MLAHGGRVLTWGTLNDATEARDATGRQMVLVQSLGAYKGYHLMRDVADVFSVAPQMCLAEVVLDDTARPYLDFDTDVSRHIPVIADALERHFEETYGVKVRTSWIWSLADTFRWHCIVTGAYFCRCWKYRCLEMIRSLQGVGGFHPDPGVYRSNSSLRMPSQYKWEDGRYHKMLVPYKAYPVSQLFVTPASYDSCIAAAAAPGLTRVGSENGIPAEILRRLTALELPPGLAAEATCKVLDRAVLVRLRRVAPSYCYICRRVHHCENSYLLFREDSVILRCFRSARDSTGAVPGLLFEPRTATKLPRYST